MADLIYLDPPFNSKRDYNLLFKSPKGALERAGGAQRSCSVHGGQFMDVKSDGKPFKGVAKEPDKRQNRDGSIRPPHQRREAASD